MQNQILFPLALTNSRQTYDFKVNASGGGSTGQVGAVRLGIARALISVNPELRPLLKQNGLLTRDSRKPRNVRSPAVQVPASASSSPSANPAPAVFSSVCVCKAPPCAGLCFFVRSAGKAIPHSDNEHWSSSRSRRQHFVDAAVHAFLVGH
jgi:hypothetical protein